VHRHLRTGTRRQSVQDQSRPSEIQHAALDITRDIDSQLVDQTTGKMAGTIRLSNQQPIFSLSFHPESSSSAPNSRSCFCMGSCTCPLNAGAHSTMPANFGDTGMSTISYEADWSDDIFGHTWLEHFPNVNADTVLDPEDICSPSDHLVTHSGPNVVPTLLFNQDRRLHRRD
jgi:hypothetical protein